MPASEDVKQAMTRFYELFSGGDADQLRDFIAADEDAFVIGTDPNQWEMGRDTWADSFRAQTEQMPGIGMRAGARLAGYEKGDVGWAADEPSIVLPDGTPIPVRVTGVFHREGGEWRVVTVHVSFGVPDAKLEELLPQLLS